MSQGDRLYKKRYLLVPLALLFVVQVVVVVVDSISSFTTSGANEWSWVGAVTEDSAAFRVRAPNGESREFVLATSSDLVNGVVYSEVLTFAGDYDVKAVNVSAGTLSPNTKYFYGQKKGSSIVWSGSFKTPVPEGSAMDFRVSFAGCALTGTTSPVFNEIKAKEPFMMLHAGDLHYADIDSDDVDERIGAYDRVLASESMRNLYTSVAMAYIWDDHDFCGNNKNADCPGRTAARHAYQKGFPHYPLAAGTTNGATLEDVAPYQAFTIGTIRFIFTDLRSEAVLGANIMSPEQKAFLQAEFTNGVNYDFVVWVSSKPWVGEFEDRGDSWQGHPGDREEISNMIADTFGANKQNLLVVSSDAHMVAFDDGTNTDYSNNTDLASFPLLQAGPLNNIGSTKGGPYSEGCHTFVYEMNNQFAILDFKNTGTSNPCIEIETFRYERTSGSLTTIFKKELCGQIFGQTKATESTCDGGKFKPASIGLGATAYALLVILIVVSAIVFPKRPALFLSLTTTCAMIATVVGGVLIAFAFYLTQNSFQLPVLYIMVFQFLQVSTAIIFFIVILIKYRNNPDATVKLETSSSTMA